jgi:subtilisin family serine protease
MRPERPRPGLRMLLLPMLLVAPAVIAVPAAPAGAVLPGAIDIELPGGHADLAARIAEEGRIRVIVGLRTTYTPEGVLGDGGVDAQRDRIVRVTDGLERELDGSDAGPVERLATLASVVVEVGPSGLDRLLRSPRVRSVEADVAFDIGTDESIGIVDADLLHAAGVKGSGRAVAIIDTGVDRTHPFFAGRIVAEACFSTDAGVRQSLCPDGSTVQIGPGSGVHCDLAKSSLCFHGTHVAGIAAGAHSVYGGVAPAAEIVAIQAFHLDQCSTGPCLRAALGDLLAALDHAALLADQLAGTTRLVAVNMSLGGGLYGAACDGLFPAAAAAVNNLASKGVAVIAASGNDGVVGAVSFPACLSGTVAVGSTTKSDGVSSFTNTHPSLIDLLAPGSQIVSAYPDARAFRASGTSAAAPHVAGAWALLSSLRPDDGPAAILSALRAEGAPVLDTRTGAGFSHPRLALAAFVPEPEEEPEPPEEPLEPATPEEPGEPLPPTEPGDPTLPDEGLAGLLRVTTSPAVVSSITVDGIHRADWGLDWLSLPVGSYEVCFGDVPGFLAPDCRTVAVEAGATTVVEGRFLQLGLLKVDVLPGGLPATIHVDGEWRDEYGLFAYALPGSYEVCWGDVPGYAAPPCAVAVVGPGSTATVVGTYEPSASPALGSAPVPQAYGYLRATTSPAVVSSIRVNGVVRGDWGLNWVKVPVGTHEVCFSGVPGFAVPPCRVIEILEGLTTETQGAFTQLGLLRVDVDPSVAIDVVIDGVPRNQFGLFSFFAPGTYEVCGTPAPDGRTAPCVQAVVVPGETTRVVLEYG